MEKLPLIKWDLIHPSCRSTFMALYDDLAKSHQLGMTPTLFRPFEGYRSPERQQLLFDQKKSKARPYQSAHQYGLAVDFVAWEKGAWSWHLNHDWDFLRSCASARGLINNIAWDRPHVEAPQFAEVRRALIPQISGSAA